MSHSRIFGFVLVMLTLAARGEPVLSQQQPFQFHLVEATIADVHRGTQTGQLTCRALVQAYLNRAKAYNGSCNQLVTEEMAPKFLPDYDQYAAAVKATASLPLYVQFIGIGGGRFPFIERMGDRYPNVGFMAVPDIATIPDDALYEGLVTEELATWLRAAARLSATTGDGQTAIRAS